MQKLSLKTSLILLAAVPIFVLAFLGGSISFQEYQTYTNLKDSSVLQQFANSASKLGKVIPAEAFAKKEDTEKVREATDATFERVFADFETYKALGNSDPTISKLMIGIEQGFAKLKAFRIESDAGRGSPQEQARVGQPIVATAYAITSQSAATIPDLELAKLINGFHALLQLNDSALIERGRGAVYLASRPLNQAQYNLLRLSINLKKFYKPVVDANLPDSIRQKVDGFDKTPAAQVVNEFRANLYANNPDIEVQPDDAEKWWSAASARVKVIVDSVDSTRTEISNFTQNKLTEYWNKFLIYSVLTFILIIAIVVQCIWVISLISRSVRSINDRMTTLVEGDKDTVVPQLSRTDEIGEMARSVEVFRLAAIENENLQQEADEIRARSEVERVEMQQKAEADADAKLTQATSGLKRAIKSLATGNMECEIQEEFSAEFEDLRHDFNQSVCNLRNVLLNVSARTQEVDGGSSEISKASDILSQRTENQAASIEEASAALTQITANVRSTTERTGEARNVVREARAKTENSASVVQDAIAAMENIEKSSNQINQIISVIDEIAFQTNLLALNAGVEAARAGEAGKGFAVVAQEVRELAQRSAEAAREIKELISNSANAVKDGVQLVGDTGGGLAEIETLIHEVNEHMEAIANAAEEQSTGLTEVNSTVGHMDQATQQNAAMAEEMSGAGAGLTSEAAQLRSSLEQFKLGQQLEEQSTAQSYMKAS